MEWLEGGSLPAHWQSGAIKRFGTVTLGKMLQSDNKDDQILAPYMRAANVQPDGALKTDDVKSMWFYPGELRVLSLNRGDVVVVEGGIGGYGRAAYVRDNSLFGWGFQNSINRIRPMGGNDGRYLTYVLLTVRALGYLSAYCNVVSMPHLTAEKIAALSIPLPPVREQRRIADFLDHETAQIDALIAKQEHLINGLLERRESLVSHTVFSGLRGGELRDNGEAWLPPTPAKWPVTQLGFVTDTLAGYAFSSDGFTSNSSSTRLLRGINIKPGAIDWSETVYWDENLNLIPSRYRLVPGDLVLGMDRPLIGAGVRVASISESDAPSLLLQRVMRIRPLANSALGYLRHLFSTRSFYMYLEPMFTGVSVPHISEWQVRKFRIPLPPIDEQREIAHYLDKKTAEIDGLISKAEEFVGLVRERRAALIAEAVTGRIDVSTGRAREGA